MMNKRSITLGIAALFLSVGLNAAPAMAETQGLPAETAIIAVAVETSVVTPELTQYAQRQISPAQAKSIALSRVRGGQYVDLRKSGNYYIVRVRAPGGRVVDIRVDATTGRVN